MKKTILLLLFLSLSITCMAQSITLSGASPSGYSYQYNGVYNLSQTNPSFFSGKDPGTNVYAKSNSNIIYSFHYIFRSNNYWYIANDWNAGGGYYGSQIAYRWNTFSNSIDPPCLADWEKYTDPVYETDPYNPVPITPEMPSGNFETLAITGICFDTTSCNTSFLAASQYIQLPTIPNQGINSISPTHKGMMTYDCEQGKLMLHDGNEWIMVQGSKEDVILPENANITFDNGYKISQIADGLNVNTSGAQFLSMNSTGFNKVGINNSSPSSSVHMTGSNAHSVTTTSSDLALNQIHRYVIVTGTVTRTMTLPDPTTCSGRIYHILNYNTQNINISTVPSGIQIDATIQTTTYAVVPTSSTQLISNGTKWFVIHN